MHLRVYDSRDSSHQSAPSPSQGYSFTNAHRSIGYRNHNSQILAESVTRLMHLRVYDSRDRSCQTVPSPSLCYLFTHEHITLPTPTLITITSTQVLWFLECLTRPTVSCGETTRTCQILLFQCVKVQTVELELTKELNIRLVQSGIHVFSILYYTCFTRFIL